FLAEHYQVLAETLLPQGEHAEAAQAAEELARVAPADGTRLAQAARILARCTRLAANDSALAGGYAGRALALLRQALAKGAVKPAEVAKDADFAALRGRPGFEELLRPPGP